MRTASVWDMLVLMHEIDGSKGDDNPSRVKRTRRVFPRPIYTASSACSEMLWCGELARVRSRAIAVGDYFARTLSQKQNVNLGFIARILDPILPAWFCDPRIYLIVGFRYAIITRDGRKEKVKETWTVSQVMERGGVEVGGVERPGMYQPSPPKKNKAVVGRLTCRRSTLTMRNISTAPNAII